MDINGAVQESLALIKKSKIALLGTQSEDGFPYIKAMMNLKSDGLKKIWFSTNTASRRVSQIVKNPKASVYYYDPEKFKGLLLTGTIAVVRDEASRKELWFDGCEQYYPLGIDDPDYSVLIFTAQKGNFYHELENIDFTI